MSKQLGQAASTLTEAMLVVTERVVVFKVVDKSLPRDTFKNLDYVRGKCYGSVVLQRSSAPHLVDWCDELGFVLPGNETCV